MIGFPIPPIFFVVPIDTGGEGEKVFLIPPYKHTRGRATLKMRTAPSKHTIDEEELVMKNFQTTTLLNELFENLNLGYPNCFGVKREPDWENLPTLYTQRRRAILTDLFISLRTVNGQQIMFTKDSFRGFMLLDNKGERPNRVRVVLLDENGTPLLASDREQLCGQIIVIADQAVSSDPKLVGIKTVFGEGEDGPSSAILWDCSRQLIRLWTLEAQLMGQERGAVCEPVIHF